MNQPTNKPMNQPMNQPANRVSDEPAATHITAQVATHITAQVATHITAQVAAQVAGQVAGPVTVSGYAAASLVELLELCDEFFRTASPAVRAELRAFLDDQPTRPDAGWMIDMLGFNSLYLQNRRALTQTGDPK